MDNSHPYWLLKYIHKSYFCANGVLQQLLSVIQWGRLISISVLDHHFQSWFKWARRKCDLSWLIKFYMCTLVTFLKALEWSALPQLSFANSEYIFLLIQVCSLPFALGNVFFPFSVKKWWMVLFLFAWLILTSDFHQATFGWKLESN